MDNSNSTLGSIYRGRLKHRIQAGQAPGVYKDRRFYFALDFDLENARRYNQEGRDRASVTLGYLFLYCRLGLPEAKSTAREAAEKPQVDRAVPIDNDLNDIKCRTLEIGETIHITRRYRVLGFRKSQDAALRDGERLNGWRLGLLGSCLSLRCSCLLRASCEA